MTFWGGSGSADPCLWLMDPDSDPGPGSGSCYFRHSHSRCQQKTIFLFYFFCLLLFEGTFCIFFQFPDFWLMDPDPNPGGPKTCGSGGSGSATLISRGPTFRYFVNIRTEASMQDVTVARQQEYKLPSPPTFKYNVLRESLSVDSQNIPCATLKRKVSWVIAVYRWWRPSFCRNRTVRGGGG